MTRGQVGRWARPAEAHTRARISFPNCGNCRNGDGGAAVHLPPPPSGSLLLLLLLLMVEYSVIHSNFMRRGVFGSSRHLVVRFRFYTSIHPSIHPPRPTSPHAVTTQSALNPDFLSAFSPLSSLPSSIERPLLFVFVTVRFP